MTAGVVNFIRIRDSHLVLDHSGHPVAPPHPQHLAWAYELIEPHSRVYGIDADAVLAAIIERYPVAGSEREKAAARARHAYTVALALMAQYRTEHHGSLPDTQEETLRTLAWTPVSTQVWNCPAPLVLVDVVYAPHTANPAPIGNIRWLHSHDADGYLQSLREAGAATVRGAGPV